MAFLPTSLGGKQQVNYPEQYEKNIRHSFVLLDRAGSAIQRVHPKRAQSDGSTEQSKS